MALEKEQYHKGYTPNYWALEQQYFNFLNRVATVKLGLYKDAATYLENPKENKLLSSDIYEIKGADFDTIFNVDNTIEDILFMIFNYIINYPVSDDQVNIFADAQIVA